MILSIFSFSKCPLIFLLRLIIVYRPSPSWWVIFKFFLFLVPVQAQWFFLFSWLCGLLMWNYCFLLYYTLLFFGVSSKIFNHVQVIVLCLLKHITQVFSIFVTFLYTCKPFTLPLLVAQCYSRSLFCFHTIKIHSLRFFSAFISC